VEDKTSGAVNSRLTPGHGVQISGKNIKISGTDGAVGIHLIDGSGNEVRVPVSDILENGPTKLLFICPVLSAGEYTLHITTQYSGNNEETKIPRSYTLDASLSVG
jgi:hypothetical protein